MSVPPPGEARSGGAAPLDASAASLPHWRGPGLDGVIRDASLDLRVAAPNPRILWSREVPRGFSSIVSSHGVLVTLGKRGGEEVISALSLASGNPLWETRYPVDYETRRELDRRFLQGPRATPTVDGERVYTIGTTGMLYCTRLNDGAVLWRKNLVAPRDSACPTYGFSHAPLVARGKVFVQSGMKDRTFVAFDKISGKLLWASGRYRYGYGSPILARVNGEDQVIFFAGQAAVGVAADSGEERWNVAWHTHDDVNAATPIFSGGRLFLSSGYGVGGAQFDLTVPDGPRLTWKSRAMTNHYSTSALHDGHLYGFSEHRLRCVDWATGRMRWDQAGLGRGFVTVAGRLLLVMTQRGELAVADAKPSGYDEHARWPIFDATDPSWASPVVVGTRVVLKSERRVVVVNGSP